MNDTQTQFASTLLRHAIIAEVLGALGGPPTGWDKALAAAGEAEFELLRGADVGNVLDRVRTLEHRLADRKAYRNRFPAGSRPDQDAAITRQEENLAQARSLVNQMPEIAERRRVAAEREQRRQKLQRLTNENERRSQAGVPTTQAQADELFTTSDAVRADEVARAEEIIAEQKLSEGVTKAHEKAKSLLTRDLRRQIIEAAKRCREVVGSKALNYGAFPGLAPAEIGQTWDRARYLNDLASKLDGQTLDLAGIYADTLGDDFDPIAALIFKQTGSMPKRK